MNAHEALKDVKKKNPNFDAQYKEFSEKYVI